MGFCLAESHKNHWVQLIRSNTISSGHRLIWWRGCDHGRPQKFFQGGKRQNFADPYQVADNAMQM